ncbi:MAG: bifunctional phosphopantothenoylcysteine decarboxylase/phosphopantothenate--cysteine ligase CoaBC [Actinomycetota bacterium]|jgi:phosphopantothenoylcysteine decarboxylase/phosphopantothenate--cysteine ligase
MSQVPSAKNVVVGVTGGIAAYKAVGVIRALVLAGHDVHVVATDAALRFVGRPTLEALSRNIVHTDLYEGVAEVRHVAIGQAADLIVIAPATANTLAKLACGIADDLLGNTVLASRAPVVVAPAMHTEMWADAATMANVEVLRRRGVHFVGPVSGQLTGSDSGVGRLAEAEAIAARCLDLLGPRDLEGRRVLISAGGTREALDPVRFIGNRSSGRQGVALAQAAHERGATVTLVAANLDAGVTESIAPGSLEVVPVVSAAELQTAMNELSAGAHLVIMAAAVADYRPAAVSADKIKKDSAGERLTLELVRNPDILAGLVERRHDDQVVVGFGAETARATDELIELGRAKLARKGCDYLVLNRVGWTEGFSTPDNEVVVLDRGGDIVMEAAGSKSSVAHRILDLLV